MKIIEVDEELYQYIASHTQSIGESASDILRRLLHLSSSSVSSTALNFADEKLAKAAPNNQPESKSAAPTATKEKAQNQPKADPTEAQSAVQKSIDFEAAEVVIASPNQANEVQPLVALLQSDNFKQDNKGVSRFLSILTCVYQINPQAFAQAIGSENVQGRTRTYFAQDEKTLLQAGSHTKPKAIPNTPYWVITNNNSGRKMIMLESVMREMALPHDLIEQVKNAFVGG